MEMECLADCLIHGKPAKRAVMKPKIRTIK